MVFGVVLLTAAMLCRIAYRTLSDTVDLETQREWIEWGVFATLLVLSMVGTTIIVGFALAVQFGGY